MSLLQTWYAMSDYEVEERINDSLSFSYFCGLSVEEASPDHSTLSRFRTLLTERRVYDNLFTEINKQLEKKGILVKKGIIVDASIIDTPYKPRTKAGYEIEQDRNESQRTDEELKNENQEVKYLEVHQPSVDTQARWIKKGGRARYGYKKHVLTNQDGLIIGALTTPANVNEICNLEDVLQIAKIPENIPFYGDKGYNSEKNSALLKSRKLINRILKKAKKNRPLKAKEKLFNKLCGKTRFKVERTFGSIRSWFKSEKARYRGIAKTHSQVIMESIGYNLYRSPGIVISNAKKG